MFTSYTSSREVFDLGESRSRLLEGNRAGGESVVVRSRLKRRFSDILAEKFELKAGEIEVAAQDINSITSDSVEWIKVLDVDDTYFAATFSGEGKQVFQDAKELAQYAIGLGGYEGSVAGGLNYLISYYEYVVGMLYGRKLSYGKLGEEFGKYEVSEDGSEIEGLGFLQPLFYTRSANQNTTRVNPIVVKFSGGVRDRGVETGVEGEPEDIIPLLLESVFVQFLKVGDILGPLRELEFLHLGNTSTVFKQISEVFPTSQEVREGTKRGLTTSIRETGRSYSAIKALTGKKPSLAGIFDNLRTLSLYLDNITDSIESNGFKPGGYVASLDLTHYEPDRERLVERLVRLGFNRVEVQDILSFTSFEDLLVRYSPLTDSQDVISFFKAYDLTKLIYQFGGEKAIQQYVDYLYGKDEGGSLLRLLKLLDVNRTQSSRIIGSEYSKLIGYMVQLTYAVNPQQLQVFDQILSRNNLDLFESITFLYEQGVDTVIKRKEDVDLLDGVVAQMVLIGSGEEYVDQRPVWNEMIAKSAGKARDLEGLYNRVENITPSEMYEILGGPSPTSPFGKLLEGVKGGRLTSLLKYCNLFGLLYTLSPFSVSGQLVNEPADQYVRILEFVDNLKLLSNQLKGTSALLDPQTVTEVGPSVYTNPVVTVQNKEFGAMTELIEGGGNFNSNTFSILPSPGIGNAMVPNGVRITNSLTPEEAALVSSVGGEAGLFTRDRVDMESGAYIKVSVSNILASGTQAAEIVVSSGVTAPTSPSPSSPIPDYSTSFAPEATNTTYTSSFDPVKSCEKFGGDQCKSEGKLCSTGVNKSIAPEVGYGETPFNPGAIGIDRPLGTAMAPTVKWNEIPKSNPQYTFSGFGLSEMSRTDILKDSEFLCASLSDPFEYGACMSLLKCKRFNPPYGGKYWFEFCPSTLHGGRLKK